MTDLVVVEIGGRGKLVVGEPYFTPGVPLVLESKGLGDLEPGDLAVVRPGKILFEMEGVSQTDASEAMRLASHKLPLRTVFVKREGAH